MVVGANSLFQLGQTFRQLSLAYDPFAEPEECADDEDRTVAAMIAPCSENARGGYLTFWPRFKITDCDLERPSDLTSVEVNANMKSDGNRSRLRLTA